MALWVGTSGYNYPEWRGSFYPEKLPAAKMLPYYAERLSTVEINNTFYRMPTEKSVDGWSRATPAGFRLTLKAPQQITHVARLRDCAAAVRRFIDVAQTLGAKLGALLFQLPPYLRANQALLQEFLRQLPQDLPAAFEFRHGSWFSEQTFDLLHECAYALCVSDSEKLSTPPRVTARYAYFRLRDEGYQPADLRRWAARIRELTADCEDVFVYFKHEEAGKGPQFARLFLEAWASG
ncbi:MAG TPA: DUF72 domain-containing protein [Steroidobacteraceae bacterium]|nr:DUF72 domain-containing protein [Steroidobacteraceae bacterium]